MKRLPGAPGKWIPNYVLFLLIASFLLNVVVFFGARALTAGRAHYDFSLPLDGKLPMIPWFVYIYVLAYVSWYLGFILICRDRPEKCGVLLAEMVAKLICFMIFLIVPTRITWPELTGNGFAVWIMRNVIRRYDSPDVLFPSIHCLENWLCWRGMFGCKSLGRGVKAAYLVMAILVFLSTLLVKQHVLVDLPAAVLVGEIALVISERLRLGQRFTAYCRRQGVIA